MNFPAWHDGKTWMRLIEEMKTEFGANQVTVSFDMPHGWIEYETPAKAGE